MIYRLYQGGITIMTWTCNAQCYANNSANDGRQYVPR